MHFPSTLATLLAITATALALPATLDTNAAMAACTHNNDAGRWIDSLNPADRLSEMCRDGTTCYQAQGMKMCVTGDRGQCQTAIQAASDWQSWHGDWFLWSVVQCGGMSVTINAD